MLLIGKNNSCAIPYSNALAVKIRESRFSLDGSDKYEGTMYFIEAEYMRGNNEHYILAGYESKQDAEDDIAGYIFAVLNERISYVFGTTCNTL